MTPSRITRSAKIRENIARADYGVDVELSDVEEFISKLIRERKLVEQCGRGLITSTEAASVVLGHFDTWLEDRIGANFELSNKREISAREVEEILFSEEN